MALFRIALLVCSLFVPVCSVAGSPPSVLPASQVAQVAVALTDAGEFPNFLPSGSNGVSMDRGSALLRFLYTADTRGALFPCPT